MNNTEVANLIKRRRVELNLKLEDIGKALGVHKSTISRWESGDINSIKSGHIYLLSKVLHLPIATILGFETNEKIERADVILLREDISSDLDKIDNLATLQQIKQIVETFINRGSKE